MLLLGGMVGTLVLGLVIAFKKTLSVPLIIGYAVLEGLFVGAVSQVFNDIYPGVVATAVLATASTFTGMFLAYRFGLIKVTAKFRRIMTMMIFGYAIFAVVNVIFAFATNTPFGIGGSGMLGIGISLFAVGLASFSLALDFDAIESAIRNGAPQKYSLAPRARPHRHARVALHRVPAPVRPPPRVTEHSTHDSAGAGSPAPAVPSVGTARGHDVVPEDARRELDRIRTRWAQLPLDRAQEALPAAARAARRPRGPHGRRRSQPCPTSARPSSPTSSPSSSGTPGPPVAVRASPRRSPTCAAPCRSARPQVRRSTTIAMPCPPPTHIVSRP